jgi:hypothetical protein
VAVEEVAVEEVAVEEVTEVAGMALQMRSRGFEHVDHWPFRAPPCFIRSFVALA